MCHKVNSRTLIAKHPPSYNKKISPMKKSKPQEEQKKKVTNTLPWWLHIIFAIGVYTGGKYALPLLALKSVFLNRISQIGPSLAPIGAILFLLLAANALYSSGPDKNEAPSLSEKEKEDSEE